MINDIYYLDLDSQHNFKIKRISNLYKKLFGQSVFKDFFEQTFI